MSKRNRQYEVAEAVRGSFGGAHGRVRYEIEAGVVSETDIDPEVLAVLLATGKAVAKAGRPAVSEESA